MSAGQIKFNYLELALMGARLSHVVEKESQNKIYKKLRQTYQVRKKKIKTFTRPIKDVWNYFKGT